MANGVHLIVDVFDIEKVELLEDLECVYPLAYEIVDKCNLNVIKQSNHQFKPCGYTALYLLAESHMSFHSYPEKKCLSFDLYCCNPDLNVQDVLHIIFEFFDKPRIQHRTVYR
jgi:S-adenosylmethionine decarboxylase